MVNPLTTLASYSFVDNTATGQIVYRGYVSIEQAAVPEPVTLALLGLGLVGMGVRRWRQRDVS